MDPKKIAAIINWEIIRHNAIARQRNHRNKPNRAPISFRGLWKPFPKLHTPIRHQWRYTWCFPIYSP